MRNAYFGNSTSIEAECIALGGCFSSARLACISSISFANSWAEAFLIRECIEVFLSLLLEEWRWESSRMERERLRG